jgi:hypothetical protein
MELVITLSQQSMPSQAQMNVLQGIPLVQLMMLLVLAL